MSDFIVDDEFGGDSFRDDGTIAKDNSEEDSDKSKTEAVNGEIIPETTTAASQIAISKGMVLAHPNWKGPKLTALPTTKPKLEEPKVETASTLATEVIDLTLSDPPEPAQEEIFAIRTPALREADDSDSSFKRRRKQHVEFKNPLPAKGTYFRTPNCRIRVVFTLQKRS